MSVDFTFGAPHTHGYAGADSHRQISVKTAAACVACLNHLGYPGIDQPAHYPLALAYAQLDPITTLHVLRQKLSAPFPLRISAFLRLLLQVEREALHLLAGQPSGAPTRMMLA